MTGPGIDAGQRRRCGRNLQASTKGKGQDGWTEAFEVVATALRRHESGIATGLWRGTLREAPA